ncbi:MULTISPECIES: hypothetical protein [Mesorhizobium]|uniref:hypothetical protein n=1 Tax=Mesorhizobium TaxID=68287 RepID=UPI0003CE1120|nr:MULTISPECIES: hypothetical protein [Mesorhizobium]ESY66286.1 hypothetical protein X742_19080 [Mesorhizobium sp. LNHC232B00]WJI38515.1 hypothetical protein NL534_32895 [Mesorhizobium opportunistum]
MPSSTDTGAAQTTTVLGEPRGPRSELRLSPRQTIADAEVGGTMLLHAGPPD